MGLRPSDFEKVGRMLSDQYGITVSCRGGECQTDGKHISLPALPTHIDNHRLLGFCRAWLDHECGHIVGESDFPLYVEYGKKHGVPGQSILNAIEDIRIEQVMADMWAGCEINLRVGLSEAMKKLDAMAESDKSVSNDPDNPATEADCVKHPLKQLTTGLYARGKGVPLPDWIDEGVSAIIDEADKRFNISELSLWAESTRDLITATDWLLDEYKKIRDDRNEAGYQPPTPTKVKVKIAKGQQGGTGSSLSQEDAEAINNADEIEVEYDDSDGGDQPNQDGGDGSGDQQQPKTPEQLAAEEKLAEEIVKDIGGKMAEAVKDELEDLADKHPHAVFRPYEGGLDKLVKVQRPCTHQELEQFRNDAAKAGGPMRQRLNQLLQSESRVWWRGGRRRGTPDPRRIAQLATGIGTDVLRMRHVHPAPNTACYLMIDGSGSMDGRDIHHAALAAAAFGQVLDICRHESAISAFVGCENMPGMDYRDQHRHARVGLRTYGIEYADIKRFGQPYRTCEDKLASMQHNSGGGTPLGEAVMFAADRLIERDEKRKVLIAFTDGHPNDMGYAKWACEHCEKRGVETVLVGIGDSTVQHIHNRNAVCNSIDQLSTTTMIELTKALRHIN